MYVYRSSAYEMVSEYSDSVNCSRYRSCVPCTTKNVCKWSLVHQNCRRRKESLTLGHSHLTIRNQSHCPRYVVTKKSAFVGEQYKYTINLSNDVIGYARYLQRREIICDFGDGTSQVEAWIQNDTVIVCNSIMQPDFPMEPVVRRLLVYAHSVIIDGELLGLDDMSDYYFHSYRSDSHHHCGGPETNDDCVSAFWYDTAGKRNYLKRCPATNPCTGSYTTLIGPTTSVAFVPELKILTIDPIVAPWTGATTITIRVTNRWAFIEDNAIVTVAVAGRDCADPRLMDDGHAVACEMSPVATDELGRVRVRITLHGRDHYQASLSVTSLHNLHMVRPEITGFSPTCGHVNGGTRLKIAGRHLNGIGDSTTVNITVGEQHIECRPIELSDDHITCETGRANENATGVVQVKFGRSLVKYIADPLFVYTAEPTLYVGQRFEGLASGGTTLMVRGRHFSCITTAEVFVKDAARKTLCVVLDDTRMACRSPGFLNTAIVHKTLDLGVRVHFLDREFDLYLPLNSRQYHLYSDPEITSFQVLPVEPSDSAAVVIVIHGLGLDHGYVAEDVIVRPGNSVAELCNVTSIHRDRIICQSNNTYNGLHQLDSIVVAIGNALVYNVTVSKSYQTVNDSDTIEPDDLSTSSLYGVISFNHLLQFVVFVIVLCIIVVYVTYFRSKTTVVNETTTMATYPLSHDDLKCMRRHKTTSV